MAKVGRPVTKTGSKAIAKRTAERERYRSLPLSERKSIVSRRDKGAQRRADAKRLEGQRESRNAYHRQVSAAHAGQTKPKTCQWPGCKRTDIQLNHQGAKKWFCPTHHAAWRRSRG